MPKRTSFLSGAAGWSHDPEGSNKMRSDPLMIRAECAPVLLRLLIEVIRVIEGGSVET